MGRLRPALIRDTQAERIAETKAAIKEAYREDWRDLFKRQREEVQAVKDMTATTGGRIKALLSGRAGDAFDYENRGTLAGAFRFIAGGQVMTDKLEKAHEAERQELGDLQRLAEREEIRVIKQETKEHRAEITQTHEDALTATRESYDDCFKEAFDTLDLTRRMIEDEGRDMSKGDIAEREDRPQWGLSFRDKQGDRAGWGFGRGGREDDDDDERPFKPPTPGAKFSH